MVTELTADDLEIRPHEDGVVFAGALNIRTLTKAEAALKKAKAKALDLSGLTALDTPGALFLCEQQERMKLASVRPEHQALLDLICELKLDRVPHKKRPPAWKQFLIRLGKASVTVWNDMIEIITFTGRAAIITAHAITHPRYLRLASISRHVEETGVSALPIVAMMAIMISVVVGYQGVAQLRPFGGEDFTINLVAVSMLREMGVLVTAIMVAGRSGSAFTAEIGVMKAREEVDALQVLGMNPMELLVVPRLLALLITLPLLTFFADIMGLVGGAGITYALLEIGPMEYMDRVGRAVDGSDLFVGLFKAPVFAFFIAIIGCMHGLKVRGSAESVGKETTAAVVKTIFVVLIFDALFSVLFEELGL